MNEARRFEAYVEAEVEKDDAEITLNLWPEAYEFLATRPHNDWAHRDIDPLDIALARVLLDLGAAIATVAKALALEWKAVRAIRGGNLDEYGWDKKPLLSPIERCVEPVKCAECGGHIRILPCRACRAREWKRRKQ